MTSKANQSQGMLLFPPLCQAILRHRHPQGEGDSPYTQLTALPQSHPTVLGAASMRGTTIPVIDMAMAVGYRPISREEMPNCFIIITGLPPHPGGFPGGGIDKITECNWRDIEPPPLPRAERVRHRRDPVGSS